MKQKNKVDALAKVQRYTEDTGSTWYTPDKKELWFFQKAVERKVLVENKGSFTTPLIQKQEEEIAKYAVARLHIDEDERKTYPKSFLDIYISLYEAQEKIHLDEWQKEAVYQGMNNNLFVLTGGPGTGKTCVLKCIYFCLRHVLKTEDILFTAPTGKAARRITESVGCNAFTVAKVLGLVNEKSKPKKLKHVAVIVDEISMLDTYTAHALFSATDLNTKLILVGDVEQLPSVGYGSVLRDLIDAGIPCTKLEKTFRQASESGLFANIEQIKAGLHMGFVERDDFKVYKAKDTAEAKDTMVREFLNAVDRYGLDQVVCLTPYRRKGEACAIKLNNILQGIINPPSDKPTVTYTTTEEDGFKYQIKLQEGDPVMQLVNAEKVANGDVGKVKEIDIKKRVVTVEYVDCCVDYKENELSQLTLAYAMSVHKSQGSEYACVITSAIESDKDMLSRNTIYTAVTRAKKECIVITNGDVAQKACERETGYERFTKLCDRITHHEAKYKLLTLLI